MKKLLITVIIIIMALGTVQAQNPIKGNEFLETYRKAESENNKEVLTYLSAYLSGMVKGIQTTNVYHGMKGKGGLFCTPDNVKIITPDRMMNLMPKMQQDFKDGKTVYAEDPLDAPLSITLNLILNHYYSCN